MFRGIPIQIQIGTLSEPHGMFGITEDAEHIFYYYRRYQQETEGFLKKTRSST